jgi:hypothetical protein
LVATAATPKTDSFSALAGVKRSRVRVGILICEMKKQPADQTNPEADQPRGLIVLGAPDELPPLLAGHATPPAPRPRRELLWRRRRTVRALGRPPREPPHPARLPPRCLELRRIPRPRWPREAARLLLASVADVQRWRDAMLAAAKAPKTLNRRIS